MFPGKASMENHGIPATGKGRLGLATLCTLRLRCDLPE